MRITEATRTPSPGEGAPARVRTTNGVVEKLYALAWSGEFGTRPFGRMLLVDEAEPADEIFRRPEVFLKDYSAVSRLGLSRFNTDGENWARRRELTQPHYREAARAANRSAVRGIYDAAFDAADPHDPRGMERAALAAASTVFHNALGCTVPAEGTLRLFEMLRPLLKRLQQQALFGASDAEHAALRNDTHRAVEGVATWCGANDSLRVALMAMQAQAEGIAGFNPVEEYLMNLFAGVETSGATMAWAVDRLGALGDFQDEVRAEAAAGGATPLLETFLFETMRYFPPIPFLVRRVAEGCRLAGAPLAAGQVVVISIVGLHHNRLYWQEPRSFQPRRPAFAEGSYNRRAFLPFSMGPRVCGGAGLARLEILEGLKSLLERFRITGSRTPQAFDYALAMRPKTWSSLTFDPRTRSSGPR